MKKILVFDNYDSFTYNLVHLIEKVSDFQVEVFRNDKINLQEIERYDKILLSPGPGIPSQAGILLQLILTYAARKSILGVCLGHQAIAEVFGASLVNLSTVYHGVATSVEVIKEDPIFKNVPGKFNVGRYHSWIVSLNNFPESLQITAVDELNQIMALRHKSYDLTGVQFHPESILTEHGETIIKNWVNY